MSRIILQGEEGANKMLSRQRSLLLIKVKRGRKAYENTRNNVLALPMDVRSVPQIFRAVTGHPVF